MTPRPPARWLDVTGFLLRILAPVALCIALARCFADEVPPWVMVGLLRVETSSHYNDGRIVYVNQRRGRAGEVGATQALPATLRQFHFSPSLFEADTAYCERATRAILAHYYEITGDWDECVAAWRKGLGGRQTDTAITYARRVRAAGSN